MGRGSPTWTMTQLKVGVNLAHMEPLMKHIINLEVKNIMKSSSILKL